MELTIQFNFLDGTEIKIIFRFLRILFANLELQSSQKFLSFQLFVLFKFIIQMQPNANANANPQLRDAGRQFRKNISINTFLAIPFMSLNFYDSVFFAIYMIITIALFVYKVQKYPFPQYAISMQGVTLAFFALSHYMRYNLAKQGISQKESKKLVFYIVVTVLMIPLYVFQLRLQTYVVLVDFVLNWIGIGMAIAQIATAIWVIVIYNRKKNSP